MKEQTKRMKTKIPEREQFIRPPLNVPALHYLVEILTQTVGVSAETFAAWCEAETLEPYEPIAAQLERLAGLIRTALRYSPEERRELRRRLSATTESNEPQYKKEK